MLVTSPFGKCLHSSPHERKGCQDVDTNVPDSTLSHIGLCCELGQTPTLKKKKTVDLQAHPPHIIIQNININVFNVHYMYIIVSACLPENPINQITNNITTHQNTRLH